MKPQVWKIVLLCVILIAIPLKGMAGVASALCDAQHHALYQSAQHAASSDAGDQKSIPMEHHHAHHSTTSLEGPDQHASTDGSHQKCSACGSCCVGAVMMSEPLNFTNPLGGEVIFPEPFTRHVGPVPHGLDRPPRASLA